MKKRKIIMAFVVIISLISGSLTRISAYAASGSVESRGSFVLNSGEISIYESDMNYLQSEVKKLYDKLPSVIGVNALAAGKARRDELRSKGIVKYGNGAVVLNSFDFTYLADEIDNLESEYKANLVTALNGIDTYFKQDGSIVHNAQGEAIVSPQYATSLSFDAICNGIRLSQSVDHLTEAPAVANNISAGAAAWVNGKCIIGNGNDVKEAYNQGHDEGYKDGYKQGDEDGYSRGYTEGDKNGYNRGYTEGDKNGYDRGYAEGAGDAYNRGYESGYEQGKSDGYNKGYADGYADHVPDNVQIEYTYHKHSDKCYKEQEEDCYIIYTPGEVFYQWCAGCNKGNPDAQTKWQRYTSHHTLCDTPDSKGEACTEHSGVPASTSHKIMSTVCICGKTDKTIESVTIVYNN